MMIMMMMRMSVTIIRCSDVFHDVKCVRSSSHILNPGSYFGSPFSAHGAEKAAEVMVLMLWTEREGKLFVGSL